MLRIVDLELGDVDLDVIRNLLRLDHDVDRMGDHVHGAAALHAGCRFGIDHTNWNGDADHRALAEPHEIHVQWVVADRIELEVARDDAVLLAVDLKVIDRGQKPAGIDLLPQVGVIERNGDGGLGIAVDHTWYSASATLRPGGPLACLRTRRRLDFLDGRHDSILRV